MDKRSEKNLAQVHPDLCAVIRAASQAPQGFIVSYGIRTLEAQAEAVAAGNSQTMRSRHLPNPKFGNLAMAVDVIATPGDPFAKGHEEAVFGQIAAQIEAAAVALAAIGGIRKIADGSPALQWGGQSVGAWRDGVVSHFRDWGHFQLDPSVYA